MSNTEKKVNRRLHIVALTFLTFAMVLLFSSKRVNAASSISISEINYEESTITLQANSGDTAVYFSDSNQKKWLKVPGTLSSDNKITMDISWISVSSNYTITFKGDSSTTVVSVTIPKQVTTFKATFNKVKGTMAFTNASSRTIEWRKKDSATWTTVPCTNGSIDYDALSESLGFLYTKGATIYFRLAPVNGTGSSVGLRASKEISVSIPKKTSAPSVKVDGSKFIIAVKSGMAYRLVDSDGKPTGDGSWTTIKSSSNLKLSSIASKAMYTTEANASSQEEVYIQFRTNPTSTTQVSLTKTLTVPTQEGPPDVDDYGITFEYTSSSTLALTVEAASSTQPFEYTIIEDDDTLDYTEATWTSITSSTAISIDDDTAEEGDHIYIREKSITETDDDDFELASVEIDVSGDNGVNYPEAATADKLNTFITTAGLCNTSDTGVTYTFTLYSPSKTTVSSIAFENSYGKSIGSVTCKSTVATNSSPTTTDGSDAYIITTKITSTSGIDSTTETKLYANITLASGEVVESTTSSGVMMYLYPASEINNPDDDDEDDAGYEYLTSFDRVLQSTEDDDETGFTFVIDFGTGYLFSDSTVDTFTTTATAISSIKYDDYTLVQGTDYDITLGSYNDEDNDNEKVYTAKVTIYADKFEANSKITVRDTDEPFVITLNNGEVLDDVTMNLVRTATIDDSPVAWSIIEGSLEETKTTTTYDSNNNATTTTTEVITYTLDLTLFDKTYGASVSDVTWGGTSILRSADVSGGTITIKLSNAKINKLTTSSTSTNNLIITLSNGYTITSGCKLTILDSGN